MLERALSLDDLRSGISDAWKSFDVAKVNGNAVRYRIMQDIAANWHVHENSDELFYVISGTVHMDTEHGAHDIRAGQLLIVAAGTRHRARVDGHATMLVVDRLD